MLLEDYSTAVYWRIAAIFFALAALFSAGIILWYSIFRENPNMPDETDSLEKLRFEQELSREKHNLLSEVVTSFKNFPPIGFDSTTSTIEEESPTIQKPPSIHKRKPNFFQRLCHLIFSSGPPKISNRTKICKSETITFEQPLYEKTEPTELDTLDETKNNKKPFFKRFFNKKNKSDINVNNSNENTNNNNNCYSKMELRKTISTPELNQIRSEEYDYLVKELDTNWPQESFTCYTDAKVTVNYFIQKNIFSLQFYSILNLSDYRFTNVNVLIDIFYENKFYKRIKSKQKSICLEKFEERSFEDHFLIEFNKMNANKLKMNILIVGILIDLFKCSNLALNSKLEPLGGAHILLEQFIN